MISRVRTPRVVKTSEVNKGLVSDRSFLMLDGLDNVIKVSSTTMTVYGFLFSLISHLRSRLFTYVCTYNIFLDLIW